MAARRLNCCVTDDTRTCGRIFLYRGEVVALRVVDYLPLRRGMVGYLSNDPTEGVQPVRYAILVVVLGALASWLLVMLGSPHSEIAIADLCVHEVAGRAVLHGTISNRGIHGDRLVRLSSGLSSKVSVLDENGREADYLRVPADSELVLGGNAPRIEAIGLKRSLEADEFLPLLFVFERAGKVRVNARVAVVPIVSQK